MSSTRLLIALSLVLLVVFRAASFELSIEGNYGIGSPTVFVSKYAAYRARQLRSVNPDVLRIRLGYVKGLSRSFTAMVGDITFDLRSAKFTVSLSKLTTGEIYGVWLVDEKASDGSSLVPDTIFRLAAIQASAPSTSLAGELGLGLPVGFSVDRVVVTRGDKSSSDVLATGSVNVFQKIFFRRLSLTNDSTGMVAFAETTPAPALSSLVPDLAAETEAARLVAAKEGSGSLNSTLAFFFSPLETTVSAAGSSVPIDVLISQGAKLFFEETFEGNGRTCGTCHPASNNFTIDPAFIATLPQTDALFVAENNPALSELENPVLMREFGLILENVDGLEDPTNKFVMRGVPHTLGLGVSLERDTNVPEHPVEMTGWSGDGAPGTGSLREFANGAVTQHFTQRLDRVEGVDFELPNSHQLDAMEAFQLSLGRDTDFNLSAMEFQDTNVKNGKLLFINGNGGGTCNFCHANAGALSLGQNDNFDTNVEDVKHLGRDGEEDFPFDGGFGRTDQGDGTFGNDAFNTASAVEAADTAPFFHNNVETTLFEAVSFYSGPEFNAGRTAATQINFTAAQNQDITNFLRSVNALQNIDVASRELAEILALSGNPTNEVQTRLQTARSETEDAIAVLTEGVISPTAVAELNDAKILIMQAQSTSDPSARRTLINQAIAELDNARRAILVP